MRSRTLLSLAAVAVVALGGCTTIPADRGFDDVEQLVGQRLPQEVRWNRGTADDEAVAQQVNAMLGRELTADEAVQIALLNNSGLQATYEELSVAQADLVQAGLLLNPVFDAQIRFAEGGGGTGIDLGVVQDFLDVFQIPLRKRVASANFEGVKSQVAGAVVDLASDTRRGYYDLVASQQLIELRQTVVDAYEASYDLARRLHEAGNITDLQLAREQGQYEQSKLDLASAETLAQVRRQQLTALMGLWGERAATWTVPSRLPEVTGDLPDLAAVEREAVANSLDLAVIRQQSFAEASRLGLASKFAFLNRSELAAGVVGEREVEGEWSVGPAVAIPIPLFDTGRVATERARAQLNAANRRYQQAAVDLRAGVRAALAQMTNARDQAEYYRRVLLPIRQTVLDQTQLEYNAMLVGAFELLQARRDQVMAAAAYIDSLNTYWQAHVALEQYRAGRRGGFPTMAPAEPMNSPNSDGGGH